MTSRAPSRPAARAPRRRSCRAAGALLLAAALALPSAGRAGPGDDAAWVELSVPGLIRHAEGQLDAEGTDRTVTLHVDVASAFILPLDGAQELEVDYQASGPAMMITWASSNQGQFYPYGSLWRFTRLERSGRLRMDLRWTEAWNSAARPLLIVHGTGDLTLTAMRSRPSPRTAAEALAALDWARLTAPEVFGNVTINSLTPPLWRASERGNAYEPFGWAVLGLLAVALLVALARRRAWRPAAPLAGVALAGVLVADGYAAFRMAPPWTFPHSPDADLRIRDGYRTEPVVGALAALARLSLPATARVAVYGQASDWFGPQTLCFNLAPRRCVMVKKDQPTAGISGVQSLRPDELDAIVFLHADLAPPPGFTPVATLTRRDFVAVRR